MIPLLFCYTWNVFTLSNLRGLHQEMRAAGLTRYKWRFTRGPATFEAIFIAEDSPFELLLGAVGSTFGLCLRVYPGYRIESVLPSADFYALCDVLSLTRDPVHKFTPSAFFSDLNERIPAVVNLATGRVQPHDILNHRSGVDVSDGRYFIGWLDHSSTGHRVSPANLLKTLAVFGQRVHDTCLARNVSSRWTHDQSRAQDFYDPT